MIEWDQMVAAAKAVQQRAYAPYSDFQVGVALLSEGEIFTGCNVENASLGATVCAERHAVAAMIKAGKQRIEGLVVVTPAVQPKSPCGLCRQVLAEFHHHGDFEILSLGSQGAEFRILFSQLHPLGFGPKDLSEDGRN